MHRPLVLIEGYDDTPEAMAESARLARIQREHRERQQLRDIREMRMGEIAAWALVYMVAAVCVITGLALVADTDSGSSSVAAAEVAGEGE